MWYRIQQDNVVINVKLKPSAKADAVAGVRGDTLMIEIRAKPVENQANLALITLLSKLTGICKSNIELIKGKTSRIKVIRLPRTVAVESFIAAMHAAQKKR